MKATALLIPVAAAALICSQEANADFSGAYAPGNWTTTGTGSVTHTATTLTMVSQNAGISGNTDRTIVAAGTGNMTFDWSYTSVDTGTWDSGGHLVAGTYTVLAINSAAPTSGSSSVAVTLGQVIGFRVFSGDGGIGSGTLTITNFNGPVVPAPGALALLGLAGLTARRRRKS